MIHFRGTDRTVYVLTEIDTGRRGGNTSVIKNVAQNLVKGHQIIELAKSKSTFWFELETIRLNSHSDGSEFLYSLVQENARLGRFVRRIICSSFADFAKG